MLTAQKLNVIFVDIRMGVARAIQQDIPGGFVLMHHHRGAKAVIGLRFICPCGCRAVRSVLFEKDQRAWQINHPQLCAWDGNELKPTITEIIEACGVCCWQGRLIAGEWLTEGELDAIR